MKKIIFSLFIFFTSIYANEEILLDAANAYSLTMKDAKISSELINSARAIVIYPSVKKLGFIVGGLYGEGVVMIRNGASWQIYNSEIVNASLGFQIGYEDNYMVLFVMNSDTLNSMLRSNLKLGADATVSVYKASANIGVVDILDKDIYVFVSKTGAFAGVSVGGFVVSMDGSKIYRKDTFGYKELLRAVDGR